MTWLSDFESAVARSLIRALYVPGARNVRTSALVSPMRGERRRVLLILELVRRDVTLDQNVLLAKNLTVLL